MYKFELDEGEQQRLQEWLGEIELRAAKISPDKIDPKSNRPYYGAIGGGLTFSFTPTGLGTVVKVTESLTKETIDLTDYGQW